MAQAARHITVKIQPNDKGNSGGKLADAERRTGTGRNVTFPARQYSVNGERRSFALLRPIADTAAQDGVRDLVLAAYAAYEEEEAATRA